MHSLMKCFWAWLEMSPPTRLLPSSLGHLLASISAIAFQSLRRKTLAWDRV